MLKNEVSIRATSQKELFKKYVSGNLGKVYLEDDQSFDIVNKGAVDIMLNESI